jgi:hypothetical protein
VTVPKIIIHLSRVFIFVLLTALTQIGGIVFFLNFAASAFMNRRIHNIFVRGVCKSASCALLYLLTTFLIVPILARPFGRVQLPLKLTNNLQPSTFLTCLLNRNYVSKGLSESVFNIAKEMNKKYPGTVVNYLDGNFPFVDGFPLIPHLSHSDGKKIDVSFCYRDKKSLLETNEVPSIIGYGICEGPTETERNTSAYCKKEGHWQYSLLQTIVPQSRKKKFLFDQEKTKFLLELFVADARIGKIFVEPHLKSRLKLGSDKIRFHGCKAVRHDDHIHAQLY